MKLYGYFRSSAAYRVRIALALKGIDYETALIHLRRNEQMAPDYAALNPQRLVPTLVDGPMVLNQSLAIIEYLDEIRKDPPLLPGDPAGRARVRSLALGIACDIHPLNNLRVLRYLVHDLGVGEEGRDRWYHHWIGEGFAALERSLADSPLTGRFCHGDRPTLADVCLVPQIYNAERFECDLSAYPTILRINEACLAEPAFAEAHPMKQPDAEPGG